MAKETIAALLLAFQPLLIAFALAFSPGKGGKGILFGASVGVDFARSETAQRVVRAYRSWNLGAGILVAALGFGLTWRGQWEEGVPFPFTLFGLLPFLQVAIGLSTWGLARRSLLRHAQGRPDVQAARGDDAGWVAGGMFYSNRNDPALFVPKRIGWGITFNMAHPAAWLLLALPFVLSGLMVWASIRGGE